jgi:predicted ribosomally synthesized peptide with nif11-like leader
MSIASVEQFFQQVRNDPALQAKLQASASAHQEKALAAVVGIAAAAGFVFTAEEYKEAVKEILARQYAADQLSEAQLGLIVGAAHGGCAAGANSCPPIDAAS